MSRSAVGVPTEEVTAKKYIAYCFHFHTSPRAVFKRPLVALLASWPLSFTSIEGRSSEMATLEDEGGEPLLIIGWQPQGGTPRGDTRGVVARLQEG